MVRKVEGDPREVDTVTLDGLSEAYGPFKDCILWLDIEGMEYEALLGGTNLFEEDFVLLLNLEFMPDERPRETTLIEEFLGDYGFAFAHQWDQQSNHHDRIYVRERYYRGRI